MQALHFSPKADIKWTLKTLPNKMVQLKFQVYVTTALEVAIFSN